jgi:prepilin-type processing-associated H-X9-DG protein
LRQAGVLLAVPLLVESGLLEVFSRIYHSLGSAFYGLRTTVVVLFLSALLRIKRAEHFKEYNPCELGHIIGLDRMPETKTVRRKVTEMALRKRAREAMHGMAQRRIDEDPDRVGFLYVDGHVREYHGRHPLAKTKKSQHQVAKPAATDNWVHDAHGEPLLVITSEMNEGLTQVLEPILQEVKELVGKRRATVIFDRGGFSAKLFARLEKQGFDVMTYRKGKIRQWPLSQFSEQEGVIDGCPYRRCIAERKRVKVGRLRAKRKKESSRLGPQFLWMREVRVLRKDGRQTSILTTRQDLDGLEVPYRQFHRWWQENFFKYMAAEYELDGLVEYAVEDVSEGVDRPNPARRPVERALAVARNHLQRLQAELGGSVEDGSTCKQRTMRGFKVAHAGLRSELAAAEDEVLRLQSELNRLPKRVPAGELKTLTTEKKLIMDTIKMTAYQVETRLLRMLRNNYCRADEEGRTLLQAAFQSTASIEVRKEVLHVKLVPQSSPHRTEAIQALCDELNKFGAKFPGTRLRLHLAVQAHQPLTKP